ncbi:MAG: DUF2938 domain-containing protein [Paraglaciecola sp.]|uniref:DUF2938 domain-containing protein n=1 Tax=Paraglaciecola sp. TaxID=1920173 RepID=UPI00329699EA
MNNVIFTILIGIGATALMDLWSLLRKQLLGLPITNWSIVGRWIAHMSHGQFFHESIATSAPVRAEAFIGWVAHYLIGIAYGAMLIMIYGETWINNPAIGQAVLVGIVTVVAPFFIMQPGMGAGIAASRSPNPNSARVHSLINHGVFGLGLYVSGEAVNLGFTI